MSDLYKKIRKEFNDKADRLAEDARNGVVWKSKSGDEKKHYDDDLVRWAFWHQTRRTDCQAHRETTDDAYFAETIQSVITQARADERKRIGQTLSRGLSTALGDEAFGCLVAEVQWDDQ